MGSKVNKFPGYKFHHLVLNGCGPIPSAFKNRRESMTDSKYTRWVGADPNLGRRLLDKEKYCYLCWDINGKIYVDFHDLLPLPPMLANSLSAPQPHLLETDVLNEIASGATPVSIAAGDPGVGKFGHFRNTLGDSFAVGIDRKTLLK